MSLSTANPHDNGALPPTPSKAAARAALSWEVGLALGRRPGARESSAGHVEELVDREDVDADGAVVAACGKARSVRAEGDVGHREGVTCQGQQELAVAEVPELRGRILSSGSEDCAVGAEGDALDDGVVGREGL